MHETREEVHEWFVCELEKHMAMLDALIIVSIFSWFVVFTGLLLLWNAWN